MNIIDNLSAGFETVARKPWLVAVPVVLDMFLWLGPKLSIAPVIARMVESMRQVAATGLPASPDPNSVAQMFESTLQGVQEAAGSVNFFSLLAWNTLGVPSIASVRPISVGADQIVEVSRYGQMIGLQLLLMAAGLVIACLFLGMLGQVVRGAPFSLRLLPQATFVYCLRMLALVVPVYTIILFGTFISVLLSPFIFLFLVSMMWLFIYIFFVPQAITLDGEAPLSALRASFMVVRHNFWSTLGLVILTRFIIPLGLGLVLTRIMVYPVGIFVAILVNAFVGTGLAAAVFVYYRERVAAWRNPAPVARS